MATDSEALLLQIAYDLNKLQKQSDAAVGIVNAGSGRMVAGARAAAAEIEKSYGTVTLDGFKASLLESAKLQDRLTAAQTAGNRQEAKGLSEQLALQRAVQKASALQLETQLAVAKASGNLKQVAALQEVLALSQQVQRLNAVGLIGTKGFAEAERSLLAITAAERGAEEAGLALAATRVFDSAKLTTLEAGSSRLRVFGSALEPLGPYGIGAAAGVVALAVAAEQARKSMEWADTLEKTSEALGVSTDSLQKLDYAAAASSIGIEKGREALGEFNVAIGKFETHTGDARLRKWADAVKLDRDEVNKTTDPVEKLALVMAKISKLSDTPSRAAAARAFGLDGLLPIINGGLPAIDGFIGKMKEAQAAGGVISSADIARAAELNEKVEALSYLIGQHFRQAFIEAAPAVEAMAVFIERTTRSLANFLSLIPDALRGMEELIDKIPHLPKGVHVDVGEAAAISSGLGPFQVARRIIGSGLEALAERGRAAKLHDQITDLMAGKLAPPTTPQPGQQLTFDKAKKGPADQTDSLTKTAEEDLQHALHGLAEAYRNLTNDVSARATEEVKANDAAAAAEQAKLKADLAKLLKDNTIDGKTSDQLQAKIEQAQADVELARVAKNQLVARTAAFAIEDRQIDVYKAQVEAQLAQLQAESEIASTADARKKIEVRILQLRQQLASDLEGTTLDRAVKTGDLTQDQADAKRAALGRTQTADQARLAVSQASPVPRYIQSIQDLSTVLENAAVTAAHDLASGLADAIVNAKNLGDVASNVFRQLIATILSAAIEKDVAGPILAVLGLADGGLVRGPGTSRSDSVPAMLSAGEYVVNADAAAKHVNLLQAINSGKLARFADGGRVPYLGTSFASLQAISVPRRETSVTVVQPLHLHMEHAVVTSELIAEVNGYADRQAARAYAGARRDGRTDSAALQYASHLNA
jgi:hypothetical protein